MADAREKEAALDEKIRKIREKNRQLEERQKEVARDQQMARADGHDEARISVCVSRRRSPSPEERPSTDGQSSRRGAGFLRDPARDMPERSSNGRAREQRGARSRPDQQHREDTAWRQERQQIDQRRLDRARTADGNWKREWDREKAPADAQKGDSRAARRAEPAAERPARARSPAGTAGPPIAELSRTAARTAPDDSSEYSYSVDLPTAVFTYSRTFIR